MKQPADEMTSDKEGVRILVKVLIEKGIKRVVLSPGSRNAPLSVAFAREKQIQHYVILDERSAAFFALGLAQQSGEAVVLACTSGTALLNYAPAVAEAYYQRLPLIVISADRPEEWVDQDDSQTIRQEGILRNIVKASYSFPAETDFQDGYWFANRLANDAVNYALKGRRGPVHINMPFHEPLYGLCTYADDNQRIIECIEASGIGRHEMVRLAAAFNSCPKVMILAGFHLPDKGLKQAIRALSKLPNVVVLSETPSNLGFVDPIATIDKVLASIEEEEIEDFAPDLLISYGGPLISRHVKAFLRQYRPERHWYIDRTGHPADTMKVLTTQIVMDAEAFFPLFAKLAEGMDSGYAIRWEERKNLAIQRHRIFAGQVGWSDWKVFSIVLSALPEGCALQLSNSTPVRYGQLFEYPQVGRVDSNRGTSGIDGATSTAVGAACLNKGITVLITGDMGFLYDSNALWNRYITPRLKIIVMKNGGGGIFRFISGPSGLKELEECFETAREVDIRGFAELHHFRYFYAGKEEDLEAALPDFWAESVCPAILAIETPRLRNADILKDYFRCLRGE